MLNKTPPLESKSLGVSGRGINCAIVGGLEAENGADEKEDGDADGMWEGGWYTYVKPRRIVGDLLAFKVDSKFDVVPINRKQKCAISLSIFLCV